MDRSLNILLVEDNDGDAFLISELLDGSMITLQTARTLSQAFEVLSFPVFDAILLDLNLPDSNGIDTFLRINERFPMVPVVILTGQSAQESWEAALHSGAQDYLIKGTITTELLTRVISYAIERHQSAQKLRDSENMLRSLLDAQKEQVLLQDDRFTILWPNRAACESIGREREEVIGRPCYELRYSRQEVCEDCIGNKSSDPGVQQVRHLPGGRTVRVQRYPIATRDGSNKQFVMILEDITDTLELEEKYRQSQKMEALGQIAGGVAHDFNNILQAVSGYVELMQDDLCRNQTELSERETTGLYLDSISHCIQQGAHLTRQLLAFSRQQMLSMTNIDLNSVIGELIGILQRVIGVNLPIRFTPGPIDGSVYADSSQIEQIMMNLLINARDAMPDGGSITIHTRVVPSQTIQPVFGEIPQGVGRCVELMIRDSGMGITPEHLSRVFDPFFTTKEKGKGTGLGLSTVLGIINQHNGAVYVESHLGEGTSFYLYFPLVQKVPSAEPEANNEASLSPSTSKGSILVVDDERSIRFCLSNMLERQGYTVQTAQSGTQALELLEADDHGYSLVILDLIMPHMDGIETYKKITSLYDHLPVLISSGYSSDSHFMTFLQDHKVPYISKPYAKQELLKEVDRLIS